MSSIEVIRHELPLVEQIFKNEIYLASEREGRAVSRHEPQIQKRVAEILLETGAHMRSVVMRKNK